MSFLYLRYSFVLLGNIPLEVRIYGENVQSVEEINEGQIPLPTHEMHINFVKKGSIIIGLNVQHSAFNDVGHFIELIDTLLSGLLQRHLQNKNENSSYVIVSLDFLDRNNGRFLYSLVLKTKMCNSACSVYHTVTNHNVKQQTYCLQL